MVGLWRPVTNEGGGSWGWNRIGAYGLLLRTSFCNLKKTGIGRFGEKVNPRLRIARKRTAASSVLIGRSSWRLTTEN